MACYNLGCMNSNPLQDLDPGARGTSGLGPIIRRGSRYNVFVFLAGSYKLNYLCRAPST